MRRRVLAAAVGLAMAGTAAATEVRFRPEVEAVGGAALAQGSFGTAQYAAVIGGNPAFAFHAYDNAGAWGRRWYQFGATTVFVAPTGATGGVIGLSPGDAWMNGSKESTGLGAASAGTVNLVVGARRNSAGTVAWPLGFGASTTARICSVVFWASDPGDTLMAAMSARMAARCP